MRVLTRRQEIITRELPEKVTKYLRLKKQMEELKKQMEEIRKDILVDLNILREDKIPVEVDNETYNVSLVEYEVTSINKKELKEKYPEVFQVVKEVKEVLRLDIRKVKNNEQRDRIPTITQPVVRS